MCGIIGSISNRVNRNTFENSMKLMIKRGPDNSGISIFNINQHLVHLGHQRLSIIDLSDNGKQPFFSVDKKFAIIFNGEIYNYKELREELRNLGYSFTTETDTEVLLNCWIEWRELSLEKLIGMFAFAVLDFTDNVMTCVKDPFGIKPFYYHFHNDEFFFASDIASLKKLIDKKITINENAAFSFLINSKYDIGNETFSNSIYSLKPATLIKISLNGHLSLSEEVWYKPKIVEDNRITYKDAVEGLRDMFLESVRLHLRSDVPLGVTLSGGLDSSAVACAIKHLEPDFPINTFSYVAKNTILSEEKWIDIVNAKINSQAHKIIFEDDSIIDDLNELVLAQGEPFSTASIYAQFRVFKEVKQRGVTVTLDGQGGDEILCGYDGYPREIFNSLIDDYKYLNALNYLKNYNLNNSTHISIPAEIAKRYISKSVLSSGKKILKGRSFPNWINHNKINNTFILEKNEILFKKSEINKRRLSASLASELTYSRIPRLLRYADKNSMNFSIESRVPFLNIELSKFMLRMPEKFMVSEKGESKDLFKHAMKGIVPIEIINRKDKIGFEAPEKNIVLKMNKINAINFDGLESLQFIDIDKVRKHVFSTLHSNNYNNIIWRLIILSKWAENNKYIN